MKLLRACGGCLVFCAVCFQADAEFLEKPDDNTLWIENGKDITTSAAPAPDKWSGSLKITELSESKGFSMESMKPPEAPPAIHNIPISAEYPWYVFEITGIEQKGGHISMGFYIKDHTTWADLHRISAQSANPQKGYYAVNVFDGAAAPKVTSSEVLALYLYGLKLDFKYLKMVKNPDYCVEVTSGAFAAKKSFSSGDELKFTVRLKEPAEDVALRFYHASGMAQLTLNGQDKIQLKPENKDGKVWSAALRLESIGGGNGKAIKPGDVMLKASILGGTFSEPVWGTINYPFKPAGNK